MAYPVRIKADFLRSPTAVFQLIGMRVLLREFNHEVCVLTLRNTYATNSTYRSGAPVRAQWGFYPGHYEAFVGHVLWAKPKDKSTSRSSTVDVVCIGASYQFKDEHQRLYTDATTEAVIGDIATRARLDFTHDETGVSWPTIASPGHTDWAFMVELAHKRGATLFMRKVGLYCYDPVKYLLANVTAWPVVKFSSAPGDVTHVEGYEAHLSDDETTTRYRTHHLKTVDPLTRQIIETIENTSTRDKLAASAKAPTFTHYLDTPTDSGSLSVAAVTAAGKHHRFNQRLRMVVPGNITLHAGTGIVLRGFNKETDGLWYVHGVEHELNIEVNPSTYWCHLTLLRDSHSTRGAPTLPDRQVVRAGLSPRESKPVLVNGRFISAHRTDHVLNYGKLVAA